MLLNCVKLIINNSKSLKQCKNLLEFQKNKFNVITALNYSKNKNIDESEEIFESDSGGDVRPKNLKRKPSISKGVKLYPGFQDSVEDIRDKAFIQPDKNEMYAKQLIEEFYGLNELEYENADDVNEEDNVISSLKRDEVSNSVFDAQSAIQLLKRENIFDICCIKIPEESNYANYMIIGTCKSVKHLKSAFINFNKAYKKFKSENDRHIMKSGSESGKWCAIDTGNLAIHLFSSDEYRMEYDLESLWTVGAEYDDKVHEFLDKQKEMRKQLDYVELNETTKNL